MKNSFKLILLVLFLCLFIITASGSSFKFALLTDIHISQQNTSLDDLRLSVAAINKQSDLAFVLVTGDLADKGDMQALKVAKTELDALNIPYYAIPGNHETKWSKSGVTDFSKIFGSDKFYFEHQDFAFIGINTGPIIRMMDGHVAKQDLIWMKEQLDTHAADKPVVVVTHYPLLDGDVDNWYEVTDLIRQYKVKAVLGGHFHKNQLIDYDGIPAFINRSNLRGKEKFGGFSVYTITKDSIIVEEQLHDGLISPWGGYSLNKEYYTKDNSIYYRPDYSVNQSYPQVNLKWMNELDAEIYASPAVYKNKIYVGDDSGILSCFDLKSGKLQWQFKTNNRILGAPAVKKNVVVFGSTDHYIYGVHAKTGDLLWKLQTDAAVIGAVSIHKNKAYIVCSDHKVRCIDISKGKLLWSDDVAYDYDHSPTMPSEKKGVVFCGTKNGLIFALHAKTGKVQWKHKIGNSIVNTLYPLSAKEAVFTTGEGKVGIIRTY